MSNKQVRPWDIFNKNLEKVAGDIKKTRLDICNGCEHFIKLTSQCNKCGCIMNLKAQYPDSVCPIGKWNSVTVGFKSEDQEKKMAELENTAYLAYIIDGEVVQKLATDPRFGAIILSNPKIVDITGRSEEINNGSTYDEATDTFTNQTSTEVISEE